MDENWYFQCDMAVDIIFILIKKFKIKMIFFIHPQPPQDVTLQRIVQSINNKI